MAEIQNKEQPVLSISLLVSNRIDTIRKCMESLRSLRENVRSELIVVDTGGTDGSMEIVREYADRIVKFQWCNDFAAARNAGLQSSSGEWFLFLDDDEWFEDTGEIEEFFLTGEYRNYKSAQYLVRNYAAGGSQADAYVSRLCELNARVRFAGSIHEYLTLEDGPVKYFKSFVHHYGYYYQTEEEKQKHFERNVTLLKKELRINPTDIRLLCQLAQEYETISDLENEEAVCRLAMNHVSKGGIQSSTAMNWIMAALVRVLALQGKSRSVLKEGRRILDRGLPYELSRSVIQAYMTEEALKAEDYQQAVFSAREYMVLINALEENPKAASSQCMLTMTFSYASSLYKVVMEKGVEACCSLGDFSEAGTFLEWLFDEDKNTEMENTCSVMEQMKERYPKQASKLTELLASVQNKNQLPYLLLQELLVDNESDGYRLQEKYNHCVERCLQERMFSRELLAVAGRKCLRHTVMLDRMDRKEWEDWLMASPECLSVHEMRGLKEGLSKDPVESLKYLSFVATLDRLLLLRETDRVKEEKSEGKSETDQQSYREALYDYCREGLQYFRRLYREEVFEEEEGINLPKECRFLLALEKAFEAEKRGNLSDCLAMIRKTVHINQKMAATVGPYIDYVEKRAETHGKSEFNQLGETVKNKVKELIEKREYAAAASILKQLELLMPQDSEIHELSTLINSNE